MCVCVVKYPPKIFPLHHNGIGAAARMRRPRTLAPKREISAVEIREPAALESGFVTKPWPDRALPQRPKRPNGPTSLA